MLGSADKETREPSQDTGRKATRIVPKSFPTWWNHQSTDWKKKTKNRKSNKMIKMPNALFTKKKKKALTGPF